MSKPTAIVKRLCQATPTFAAASRPPAATHNGFPVARPQDKDKSLMIG